MPLEKSPKMLLPESTPGSPKSNPPSLLFALASVPAGSLAPKFPKSANGSLFLLSFCGYGTYAPPNGSAITSAAAAVLGYAGGTGFCTSCLLSLSSKFN